MDPCGSQPELLVVAKTETTMTPLISALAAHGIRCDLVHELEDARSAFLAAGGHRMLVLAPDVAPSTAAQVLDSLTNVDPDLPVAWFAVDRANQQETASVRRIGYHPSSRAAVGALLKIVRAL